MGGTGLESRLLGQTSERYCLISMNLVRMFVLIIFGSSSVMGGAGLKVGHTVDNVHISDVCQTISLSSKGLKFIHL